MAIQSSANLLVALVLVLCIGIFFSFGGISSTCPEPVTSPGQSRSEPCPENNRNEPCPEQSQSEPCPEPIKCEPCPQPTKCDPCPDPTNLVAYTPPLSKEPLLLSRTRASLASPPPPPSPKVLSSLEDYHSLSRDEIITILTKFGQRFKKVQSSPQECELVAFGTGWGQHMLCDHFPPQGTCRFFSFGISNDYSFDAHIAHYRGCQGYGFDPSIIQPSELFRDVSFFPLAAKVLNEYEEDPFEAKGNKKKREFKRVSLYTSPSPHWTFISVPEIHRAFGQSDLAVLKVFFAFSCKTKQKKKKKKKKKKKNKTKNKMDCEGCEYSLARDILTFNPSFFYQVGQFAVELHISKHWLTSFAQVRALAMLLRLLEEAGLHLVHGSLDGCAPQHEVMGVPKILVETNFPGYPGFQRMMCHNYLFARGK